LQWPGQRHSASLEPWQQLTEPASLEQQHASAYQHDSAQLEQRARIHT
jgi:hypothetical protein